jgi:hypothetical protein
MLFLRSDYLSDRQGHFLKEFEDVFRLIADVLVLARAGRGRALLALIGAALKKPDQVVIDRIGELAKVELQGMVFNRHAATR